MHVDLEAADIVKPEGLRGMSPHDIHLAVSKVIQWQLHEGEEAAKTSKRKWSEAAENVRTSRRCIARG